MRLAWPGAVAALALALYIAFSPGVANPDTIDIIAQGVTGTINDWHSPAASLFAGLAYPSGMPNGFLGLQVALAAGCACCLGALAWGAMSRRNLGLSVVIATIAAYAILLIVLASSQSIKDMWIALLLASAGLLLYRSESPAAIAATCLCAIAVLVRPVSIFPAAPLIAVAVSSSTRGVAMAAGATLLVLVSIAFLPSIFVAATNAASARPASPLFVYDIVGIAVQTPDPPAFVRERIDAAFTDRQLRHCYDARTVEPFLWGDCRITPRQFPEPGTWLHTISQHPIAYFRHRFAHYTELLARIDVQRDGWVDRPMFLESSSNSPTWIGRHLLPSGVQISLTGDGDNPVLNALIRAQRFVSSIGLGSPYVWTAMAFAAIALAWLSTRSFRSRRFLAVAAISLSSVASTMSFMLFGSYAGARYLCWSLVGATLAMALALLGLARNRTRAVAGQDVGLRPRQPSANLDRK